MGALGEALVATGVGILVAIPAVAAYNSAKATISKRAKTSESMMRSFLVGVAPESDTKSGEA